MIYNASLTADNPNPTLDNISHFYTFPERNVYQLVVTGTSQTVGDFQSFTLKYDIRVAREASQFNTNPESTSQTALNWFSYHMVHIVGIIAVSLFLIGALIWQASRR